MSTEVGRAALLGGAFVTLGVLALAEEFEHLPAAVVAFAAAHVVVRRCEDRVDRGQDQTDATFLR